MSMNVAELHQELESLHEKLIAHPIFRAVDTPAALRCFMESHVFAVWDFMTLLKRLQRDLTCVSLPWIPNANAEACRLVNQIVLDEESDLGPDGRAASHLELYLTAMREVRADTQPFEAFTRSLLSSDDVSSNLLASGAPQHVSSFVQHTIKLALHGTTLEVLAAFLFGRESIIPLMFSRLLGYWSELGQQAPVFAFYLARHIDLDGATHAPAGEKLIETMMLTAADRQAAKTAATRSLRERVKLWDGVLVSLANNALAESRALP